MVNFISYVLYLLNMAIYSELITLIILYSL